jgi:hypothetical protein
MAPSASQLIQWAVEGLPFVGYAVQMPRGKSPYGGGAEAPRACVSALRYGCPRAAGGVFPAVAPSAYCGVYT